MSQLGSPGLQLLQDDCWRRKGVEIAVFVFSARLFRGPGLALDTWRISGDDQVLCACRVCFHWSEWLSSIGSLVRNLPRLPPSRYSKRSFKGSKQQVHLSPVVRLRVQRSLQVGRSRWAVLLGLARCDLDHPAPVARGNARSQSPLQGGGDPCS